MIERSKTLGSKHRVRKLLQGQSSDGLRDEFSRHFRGMAMGQRGWWGGAGMEERTEEKTEEIEGRALKILNSDGRDLDLDGGGDDGGNG